MSEQREKWHLTYRAKSHKDGLTREEVAGLIKKEDGDEIAGACDAMIIYSILLPSDGSYSQMAMSIDGRTGEQLSSSDLFKAWIMTAHNLSQDTELDEGRREFAKITFEGFWALLKANKEKKDESKGFPV